MEGEGVGEGLRNRCEGEEGEEGEGMEGWIRREEEGIEVVEKMVMGVYEDMIGGGMSEENLKRMVEKREREERELKRKVWEGRKGVWDEVEVGNEGKEWVEGIEE